MHFYLFYLNEGAYFIRLFDRLIVHCNEHHMGENEGSAHSTKIKRKPTMQSANVVHVALFLLDDQL